MEVSLAKINKLTGHVQSFISSLNNYNDINLHRSVDQFYYMQKLEELTILKAQFEEAKHRLQAIDERLIGHYQEVALRWSKDVRLAGSHAKRQKHPR